MKKGFHLTLDVGGLVGAEEGDGDSVAVSLFLDEEED